MHEGQEVELIAGPRFGPGRRERATPMLLLRRLNPRLHLAAAIGWAVFVVVTLAGLVAAELAAARAESRARADAEGLLAEFATQVRDALSMNLENRRSVLQAAAAQVLEFNEDHATEVERTLSTLQSQFPEFLWLGAVDPTGKVWAGTEGRFVGDEVADMPWFLRGRERPYVGERDLPPPSAETTSTLQAAPPTRLLDLAVPLDPLPGREGGVVAAQLRWSWVEQLLSKMQEALGQRRQLELMLAGRDGTVLIGPAHWLGRRPTPERELTEGGRYSIGTRTQLRLADVLGLGWTAIVRQPAALALEPVRTIRRSVFVIVFAAGLLAALGAAMVCRVFTRRLTRLADDAEAVRSGQALAMHAHAGADEVSRISGTLAQLVDHLQNEKQALRSLNLELDRRVAERTLRIERMADETRHAAVTRERLRIARDLHDTLAHSMMALLTQIRLIRKLQQRLSPAEFAAELDRAEAVAASGLSEARAAITQMRDNGVHDTGLGSALVDLARRFAQRTGVPIALDTDPELSSWADDRAETVFRIVEEALRNVERHARANQVHIRLQRSPCTVGAGAEAQGPGVIVEVADDGVGFDPGRPVPGHYGLRGMKEQAALIAAHWEVHSRVRQGTRVVLRLDG